MLSFPAGIVGVFSNNPNPAPLGFRIKNMQNLDNLLPNKQLVTMYMTHKPIQNRIHLIIVILFISVINCNQQALVHCLNSICRH